MPKFLSEKEARVQAQALVDEGGETWDDAVHALVDAGEIDETTHCTLLSPDERMRVYGE